MAGVTVAVRVATLPKMVGFTEEVRAKVGVGPPMVNERGADALDPKLASPLYAATIECGPKLSTLVLMTATPLTGTWMPRTVVPSKKVMRPAAEGTPPGDASVAVSVTFCP